MKAVNIAELRSDLSGYLKLVREGEEVVVKDRNLPVARILPIRQDSFSEKEARLVASGAMTLPQEEMDWDAFFATPTGMVPHEIAVQAVLDDREGR